MKKRLFTLLLTFIMAVSLIACGKEDTPSTNPPEKEPEIPETRPASPYTNSTLEEIITGIETDFSDTIKYLQTAFEDTNTTIGDSYENYIENKQALADWYDLVLTEEADLFARTEERAIEYFKLISSSIDHKDDDAIDDAMDDYYDKIYDGVMDDFYDDVYDSLMDDAYDTYYDGIVDDGYDVAPYETWIDESSEAYEAWSDTSSAVYKAWSDTRSTLYGYRSAVGSGFYNENFDVDAIIEEYQNSKQETETDSSATDSSDPSSDSSSGIRPEFQEAMDNYEAFFDEYVDFMNKYASADADEALGMLSDYADYMTQYVETMEKFEKLENEEMTTEEALLYAEVASRISVKLMEIEV